MEIYTLFSYLKLLKFHDLIDYSIIKIMCKVHKNITVRYFLKFAKRDSHRYLKGMEMFIKTKFRISLMGCDSSICLWNSPATIIKNPNNVHV